jgi:hypothetical protein
MNGKQNMVCVFAKGCRGALPKGTTEHDLVVVRTVVGVVSGQLVAAALNGDRGFADRETDLIQPGEIVLEGLLEIQVARPPASPAPRLS